MEPTSSRARTKERKPLGENNTRANMRKTPPHRIKNSKTLSLCPPPHHESLMPNGPHTVQDAVSPPTNKRLSAVTNEDQSDSKRNSQVSTTSTIASAQGKRRKTHIGPWQLGVVIGQGAVGKVRKVRHSVTGQDAAVKIISKAVAEKARAESLANLVESSKKSRAGIFAEAENIMPFGVEREVIILKLLEHQNIVKLYDVWENRNELYLIMEYVNGGELFDYISERETVPEDETVFLFRQMVGGLLHCHRLGIHHRDLKPENILIDPDTLKIKLADFGMAALQPLGKMLTTPCGSFHYAAPEIFDRIYDAAKVDVWSLGVILYVMLTGKTPFNCVGSAMPTSTVWHNMLKSGNLYLPKDLSKEARDLLAKMLTVNAKQRISLGNVWNHPFLHKYDAAWEETPDMTNINRWAGEKPLIKYWKARAREDVDREIFRNLRTLWHSEKEEILMERLLSKEPNQEKYFYTALQRHREEQLENYIDFPDGVTTSGSDYHHIKPGARASNKPPIPIIKTTKTHSQYSVLNNEHLHSHSTLHETSPSIRSYDPYRASKLAVSDPIDAYIKVSIHRGQSNHSRKPSVSNSMRRPGSLRVETLRNEQRRISAASSLSSLHHSSLSIRSRPVTARSMSRSSMTSSLVAGSPPGIVKPTLHRRGVTFQHARHSAASAGTSGSSARVSGSPRKPSIVKEESILEQLPFDTRSATRDSSPAAMINTVVRSRKEAIRANASSRLCLERCQTQDEVFAKEARKVSTELEKFCEEAFFRTSVGSRSRQSATPSQAAHDAPPSSVSNRGSGFLTATFTTNPEKSLNALPQRVNAQVSGENSDVFINQELAETRRRLAAHYAQDENAHSATYKEVLAHLDALLQQSPSSAVALEGKRVTSASTPRQSVLPVISEEGIKAETESAWSSECLKGSDPTMRSMGISAKVSPDSTRLLNLSPPPQIAPLVIRKSSGSSTASMSRAEYASSNSHHNGNGVSKNTRKVTPISEASLENIVEEALPNEAARTDTEGLKQTKKANWFQRKIQAHGSGPEKEGKGVKVYEDRLKASSSEDWTTKARRVSELQENETVATLTREASGGGLPAKRPGFLRFLTRKRQNNRPDGVVPLYDDGGDAISLPSSTALAGTNHDIVSTFRRQQHTLDQFERNDPRDLGVQRNWLARFLHIKPASKVLCFNTGRGRARHELVRLLRFWCQYGIRDVVVDRARNLIFGRLDAINHLGLKEVCFVIEMYVMLKKGKRAGLSIARFTQQKGAASSFKRVVDEVEGVLRGRGVLVERGEAWREMEAVLTDGFVSA